MGNTENMKSGIAVATQEELDRYITMLLTFPASSFWLQDALRASQKRDIVDMLADVECLQAILSRRFQIAFAFVPAQPLDTIPQVSTDLPTTHDTDTVRQFFLDIMSTAIEGGINGWAGIGHIERDKNGEYLSYQVRDYEDRGAAFQTITPEKIEEALDKIANPDTWPIKIGDTYRYDIIQAYSTLDAGIIDAMLADIIVQVAAYDEIVFG